MFSFTFYKSSLCACAAVALSACATSYGPKSFWNVGEFTETELQRIVLGTHASREVRD